MEKSIVLTRPVKIRGRLLKKGTTVEVTAGDRANLVRLGWAKDAEPEAPAPVVVAEKQKRTYKRKDLQAETPEVTLEGTVQVVFTQPSLADEVARVKDDYRAQAVSGWKFPSSDESLTRPKKDTKE